MAAGKPLLVIAHEKSEISQSVKENNIGWVIPPNNPKLLSDTFEKIYNEYAESGKFNVNSSREVALNHFSKAIILSQYNELFS